MTDKSIVVIVIACLATMMILNNHPGIGIPIMVLDVVAVMGITYK